MLFDTHVHLNDPCFDEDRAELMQKLPAQGLTLAMNAGCSLESSKDALQMAAPYDWLYCSVGSHPDSCDEVCDEVLEEYRKLCKLHPDKIKAIGEIGLDYHYEDIPREIQKKAFIAQMELARELDMPVIVHERDAHEDGMNIIRQFPTVKGVFHCYSGSAEMARQLCNLGWYIGFTGVITFKNARKAIETAQTVPLDRIVIETDCPFMAPEPFRGRRNDPGLVYRMAEKIAGLRSISVEDAQRITFENGKRLYRIDA